MIDDRNLYDAHYFEYYYSNDPQRNEQYKQERKRIIERAVRICEHRNPETGEARTSTEVGGAILDIGCGVGGFLAGFDDRWTRYGYEPSDYAADKARKNRIIMFPSLGGIESETMDVVIFRGTLQHINLPMEALGHARRILKRGGLLAILATPDSESLVYKLWGTLPALDPDKNWIIFGAKALENCLRRLGYVNITTHHPYWGTPYAKPWRDFGKFFASLFLGYRKFAFPGNMFELFAVKQ